MRASETGTQRGQSVQSVQLAGVILSLYMPEPRCLSNSRAAQSFKRARPGFEAQTKFSIQALIRDFVQPTSEGDRRRCEMASSCCGASTERWNDGTVRCSSCSKKQ